LRRQLSNAPADVIARSRESGDAAIQGMEDIDIPQWLVAPRRRVSTS
jgi:hypothetical protein